jgi:hypothetical protein
MLTRRVALPLAALTAAATLPVLTGGAPAGASGAVVKPAPQSRGDNGNNGDPNGPSGKKSNKQEKVDNCPTKQWTIPLELKGLACLLLLPKPEPPGGGGEEGGGGVGGLFG